MNDYNLIAGIHTLSIKTSDSVIEVPEITHVTKNLVTGMTTIRINPNKINGFIASYSDFMEKMSVILAKANITSYSLVRVDMCFDSYDSEHYHRYAKLNRLLISMIAQAYCVRNKYRTTDLFTSKQLSIAIKNPNSFEVENYDKAYESMGKARAKSRFEIRSTRMDGCSIEDEFINRWNTRLDKALDCFDDTLSRYNNELVKIYLEDESKMKYATFFQVYESCIFTKHQAVDLLERMRIDNPKEAYKYLKKKYKLVTYTKDDVISTIDEIKRARDVFFNGE